MSKSENKLENNPTNLATLTYIYYVKGKLAENADKASALKDYKKAVDKYERLKTQFKSPVELFKLDLNILYNGNADIVAALYRQLKKIDNSNTLYAQSLKEHLLNELDYLMREKIWREVDEKLWPFILTLAGREDSLGEFDFKKFKCEDLKQLDKLWVDNFQVHFDYESLRRVLETKAVPLQDFGGLEGFNIDAEAEDFLTLATYNYLAMRNWDCIIKGF
ncbi:MAG: hypothetical protein HC874_06080 [Richelia sp. SL_2_1]|nr:hypothetical protein [Richelia sp. SL_2_1]